MEWLELLSWVAVASLLAGLQIPTKRPATMFAIFTLAIVGALLGGTVVRILPIDLLAARGFSFSALLGAAIAAEIGIVVAIVGRTGRRPGALGGA